MNHISKPHIVDLLRIFDKRKFFVPRIRYASVRSKPELLKDLKYYFGTRLNDGIVLSGQPHCPYWGSSDSLQSCGTEVLL